MVTLTLALLLATLQGITEFLPVSSSGHLRLLEHWAGVHGPQTLLDVCLHFGTLLATMAVYRKEVAALLLGAWRWVRREASYRDDPVVRLGGLLILGTIPTGLLGVFAGQLFESEMSSVGWVGTFLIINGLVLMTSRWAERRGQVRNREQLCARDALIIGTVQGFAVLRGISRSGSTITVALWLGVERSTAAAFSFLLSIPAICGALVLQLSGESIHALDLSIPELLVVVGVSALVGFLALKLLLKVIDRGAFYRFAPYCIILGVIALWIG